MAGFGSPCGACKFLRRKCVASCVFAPFFRHEQGAAHFAAIHKVFGASNVAKLLLHLPIAARSDAAVTISYEAQARLQDPIYGCVAHIFALQQQVVDLQAQVASLEAQAARGLANGNYQNEDAALCNSAILQLPQRTPLPQLAASSSSADMGGLIFSSYNFPSIDQYFASKFNTAGQNDFLLGIEKELFPPMACFDSQDNFWKSTYQDSEGIGPNLSPKLMDRALYNIIVLGQSSQSLKLNVSRAKNYPGQVIYSYQLCHTCAFNNTLPKEILDGPLNKQS